MMWRVSQGRTTAGHWMRDGRQLTWRVAQEEDERRVPPNEEYAVVEGHDDRRTSRKLSTQYVGGCHTTTVTGRWSHDRDDVHGTGDEHEARTTATESDTTWYYRMLTTRKHRPLHSVQSHCEALTLRTPRRERDT